MLIASLKGSPRDRRVPPVAQRAVIAGSTEADSPEPPERSCRASAVRKPPTNVSPSPTVVGVRVVKREGRAHGEPVPQPVARAHARRRHRPRGSGAGHRRVGRSLAVGRAVAPTVAGARHRRAAGGVRHGPFCPGPWPSASCASPGVVPGSGSDREGALPASASSRSNGWPR